MNVLDKIEKLRLDRGWSVYRLAEKAGITDKCIYKLISVFITGIIEILCRPLKQ